MIAHPAERLRLSDYDYDLPETLIAQAPAPVRDRSRLMVLDRASGAMHHSTFSDLVDHLQAGDLLVLNNTRVFPCRIPARKAGGGKTELFLLEEKGLNVWTALIRGRIPPGKRVTVGDGMEAEVTTGLDDGTKLVRFHGARDIRELLERIGKTPLPPYIKREPDERDRERYQTVYARREGAVAAPTAGLHFTEELFRRIAEKDVATAPVTLHVGPGTFQPVREEFIAAHTMHPEHYEITPESAGEINRAKADGRRVICVGTTSVRAVETAADAAGFVRPGEGASSLFIYPGYPFKVSDGLITNFHLPKSTLLMLVAAFAGRERILNAYRTAVAERYRFYSYGDAMFIA